MVRDPVCKMDVEESKAAATAMYEGKTYYPLLRGLQGQVREEADGVCRVIA
jgi:hypothetical protein